MIPARFRYVAASSPDEAIRLLDAYRGAKLLAGGQTLLALMKRRALTPEVVIDISRIQELAYIREEEGVLRIGALTRDAELEGSPLLKTRCSVISETAGVLGDPLVRGLSTIGGNLAAGESASDHAATLLALRAEVVARGPHGSRVIPLSEFFIDTARTQLREDEILAETRIRIPAPNSGAAYEKLARRVGDYPTVGVAASIVLGDGAVAAATIGVAGGSPAPVRAQAAEDFLQGKPVNEETLAEAAHLAGLGSRPRADVRGSAEYKRDLVRVLTARALDRAVARAHGVSA